MAINQINLPNGRRAERKQLVTIAEWNETVQQTVEGQVVESTTQVREILGMRTEDSSIDYNADIETSTDILGNNYTDINKTQPQQEFDPYQIIGGSKLAAFLNDIRRRNAVSEYSQFTIYIVTMFVGTEGAYEAEKHTDCTIAVNSIGGDANVNMPITVYFSNKITTGTVDKIAEDFTFTADANI